MLKLAIEWSIRNCNNPNAINGILHYSDVGNLGFTERILYFSSLRWLSSTL